MFASARAIDVRLIRWALHGRLGARTRLRRPVELPKVVHAICGAHEKESSICCKACNGRGLCRIRASLCAAAYEIGHRPYSYGSARAPECREVEFGKETFDAGRACEKETFLV